MNIVIVGSGVAGVTACRTIQENDPKTKITLYTDENHVYYPRPMLYNVLSGEVQPHEIYVYSKEWYEKKGININLNKKVIGIEPSGNVLRLENLLEINYDKLLLANGANPFTPPIKGVEKTGVFTLRSIKDAITIREYAKRTKKVIIIGGGLLGLEFAASLRRLGKQVEVVEIFPRLLPRQLDKEGAKILKWRIEALGINIVLAVKTKEILGKETVSGILLDNGKTISGNLALISAGVRSNVNLAKEAGIKTEKGIIVDQKIQTSNKDVYAAGDVAEFEGRVYSNIPAALEQAKIAALNMLEKEKRVYTGTIPSNTLKIVGIDLASMGLVNPEGSHYEEIKKIDNEKRIYKKLVLEQGKIVGAIILGNTKGVNSIKKLIDQQTDVTKYTDRLLEDNFDFRKIL